MDVRTEGALAATLFMLLVATSLLADDKVPSDERVQELRTKAPLVPRDVLFGDKRFPDDLLITSVSSQKSLSREFADNDEVVEEIVRKIDFKNRRLIVARWMGSKSDTVRTDIKDGKAEFALRRGENRDLRPQCRLFVLPTDVDFSVSK